MLLCPYQNAFRVGLRGVTICRSSFSSSSRDLAQKPQQAQSSPLLRLRQKTGLAYSLCREALNKHNNNIEEAETWLKAQALAHGLQKATKVSGRTAREGLIGLSINKDNSTINAIEFNCETDFVARNQLFKDFALDLTAQLSVETNVGAALDLPNQDHVKCSKLGDHALESANSQVVALISKLGENIRISKAYQFRVAESQRTKLFGKIHSSVGQMSTSDHTIIAGRYGALVGIKLTAESLNWPQIQSNGGRLCQHVIGYNPTYIELPEKIRLQLEEAERERAAKLAGEAGDNVEEEFSDDELISRAYNAKDDWPSMMDQTLIMSENTSVREFCQENSMSIVYFKRFECGGVEE